MPDTGIRGTPQSNVAPPSHHGDMTRDEQFIIENADADDDLDALLATHRCADCAEPAFLQFDDEGESVWLCAECAGELENEAASVVATSRAA